MFNIEKKELLKIYQIMDYDWDQVKQYLLETKNKG